MDWCAAKVGRLLFAGSLTCTALLHWMLADGGKQQMVRGGRVAKLTVHADRQSPSDLMVTGLGPLANGAGYVRYVDLAALPRVSFAVHDDENFADQPRAVRVSGIYLADLAKAVGASPQADLMKATCVDDYEGHYSAEYIRQHQPVLGLTIDGLRAADWARTTHHADPGPYFVTHKQFAPAFKVLSHQDEPQVPTNVVTIGLGSITETYNAIAPRGRFGDHSAETEGFVIARQNCLRCHNQGAYGGTKSGRTWMTLSTWAQEQPQYFASYVRNPKAFDPYAKMPANLEYDKPTLDALTAYFRTFTANADRR